jgi:hypothetical protein
MLSDIFWNSIDLLQRYSQTMITLITLIILCNADNTDTAPDKNADKTDNPDNPDIMNLKNSNSISMYFDLKGSLSLLFSRVYRL